MKEPFIVLCSEITRNNALSLMRWLKDDEVRKYLSDTHDVSTDIAQVLDRVHLPVLTHLFNQDGRFYIVRDRHNAEVGFVRLIVKSTETEIVIVIGDKRNWGQRLGSSAIRESLRLAFFEWRSPRVVANIHRANRRSIRAFMNAGFSLTHETPAMLRFAITMDEYLALLQRERSCSSDICMTRLDQDRLRALIDAYANETAECDMLTALGRELDRAAVIEPARLPPDVVSMNSRVRLSVDGAASEILLVYPADDGRSTEELSILSPVGVAIIGCSEGDDIRWEFPAGPAAIRIDKIMYQPEAAGDYHL